MLIKKISSKKIRDSRGDWTIEVKVNGCKASSPSGKSKGKYESPSFRKNVEWNVNFINKLKIDFEINSFSDLEKVEKLIKKKAKIRDVKQFGANALFALESAILKALAKKQKKELWEIVNPNARRMPVPLGNAVGGGVHSSNKDKPPFQEFLIIPKKKSIRENVKIMNSVYGEIGKVIASRRKNDEGAWESSLENTGILEVLKRFDEIRIGLDVAASSFYKKEEYCYKNKSLDRNSQISYINSIIDNYNILYIEDPLDENDFSGFSKIKKRNMVCGDDLTVTHLNRLKRAIKSKSINCMIVKPNQNGSLIELRSIVEFCKKKKIKIVLSHRSGETMDDALADYAFGFQADYIKTGISTKWRACKLKRLIKIEKSIQ